MFLINCKCANKEELRILLNDFSNSIIPIHRFNDNEIIITEIKKCSNNEKLHEFYIKIGKYMKYKNTCIDIFIKDNQIINTNIKTGEDAENILIQRHLITKK